MGSAVCTITQIGIINIFSIDTWLFFYCTWRYASYWLI